jgi:hypothetical protein
MTEKPYITDPTIGYLTKEAQQYVKRLTDLGMDKDLAVSTVEALLSEEKTYELDE